MKKISYLLLVVLGFIGFLTLIPSVNDSLIYYYFRIVNGHSIELKNQCFYVPEGFIIDSAGNRKDQVIFNLRRKVDKKYYFSSVVSAEPQMLSNIESLKPVKEVNDLYSIYELAGLPADNKIRYWSLVQHQKLIIIGDEVTELADISKGIHSIECQK